MRFLLSWLATAVAAAVAVFLIPGIEIVGSNQIVALACFGLTLSLVDTIIKPICKLLSLPITFLTFGLFLLIINIAMIYLAANLSVGLFGMGVNVTSMLSALVASFVISIVSSVLNVALGNDN